MARKKTVSLSRKPSADKSPSVGGMHAFPASAPQLAMKLEPYGESLRETPEIAATPSAGLIGLAIYRTMFCVSYSLVFSAIMLGKFIPGSRLIGRGLQDGANAAQRSLESKPERYEDEKTAGFSA